MSIEEQRKCDAVKRMIQRNWLAHEQQVIWRAIERETRLRGAHCTPYLLVLYGYLLHDYLHRTTTFIHEITRITTDAQVGALVGAA